MSRVRLAPAVLVLLLVPVLAGCGAGETAHGTSASASETAALVREAKAHDTPAGIAYLLEHHKELEAADEADGASTEEFEYGEGSHGQWLSGDQAEGEEPEEAEEELEYGEDGEPVGAQES